MHNCSPIHMCTMKELTTRQIEILDFITNYEWRHGFWPSIRNIQMEFDYKSTNAVMGHLRALERKAFYRVEFLDKPVLLESIALTNLKPRLNLEIPENASEVVETSMERLSLAILTELSSWCCWQITS